MTDGQTEAEKETKLVAFSGTKLNTSADFVFWCGCNWSSSHPRPRTITLHDAHDFLHGSHS